MRLHAYPPSLAATDNCNGYGFGKLIFWLHVHDIDFHIRYALVEFTIFLSLFFLVVRALRATPKVLHRFGWLREHRHGDSGREDCESMVRLRSARSCPLSTHREYLI
jgi:hypothetical protein